MRPNNNIEDLYRQTLLGAQDYLTVDVSSDPNSVPVGSRLVGQALPNGTYSCYVPLAGLQNNLTVLLKATFGTGTVTTSGGSVMMNGTTVITAATGVGAMATATRQTITFTPIGGEQYGILTIVVAGGAGATINEAEFYGN